MLHLIFGRAGTGKTSFAAEHIAADVAAGKRSLLIVPEPATLRTEQMLFSTGFLPPSANLCFEVVNFSRLPNRVMRETGGLAEKSIDTAGRSVLVRAALSECAPFLRRYGGIAANDRFVPELLAQLETLRTFAVTPETLEKAASQPFDGAPALSEKLSDICLLLTRYEALLHEKGCDASDRLSRLAAVAGTCAFFDGMNVYIDGFSGFTPLQTEVLRGIIKRAAHVYVTLCADGAHGKTDIFEKPYRTATRLVRLAAESGTSVAPHTVLGEPLRFKRESLRTLERVMSVSPAVNGNVADDGGIVLTETRDIYGEAENAAMTVLRLCRTEGYAFRDILVTAREISAYSGVLDTVFAEHGIPCFISKKTPLRSKPLCALVMAAAEACASGFRTQTVADIIKTGLTPLTPEQSDVFELYMRTWKLGHDAFLGDAELTANPDGYTSVFSTRGRMTLETANDAISVLRTHFAALYGKTRGKHTVNEFVTAIYELLCDMDVKSRLEAAGRSFLSRSMRVEALECRQSWNMMTEIFEQLTLLLDGRECTARRFLSYLSAAVSGNGIGRIPASVDEVAAVSASQAVSCTPRAVIILGAAEGSFPAPPAVSGLFAESELEALGRVGIELGLDDARLVFEPMRSFYTVCTCASEHVFISCATGADTRFSAAALRAGASCGVAPVRACELPEGRCAALRMYARSGDERLSDALTRVGEDMLAYTKKLSAPLSYSSSRVSAELANRLYSGSFALSPSRLEKFSLCPLSHWGEDVMRLREEKEARLEMSDIGTYTHSILESFILRSIRENRSVGSLTREQIRAEAGAYIEEYAKNVFGGLASGSCRFRYLFSRLRDNIEFFLFRMSDEFAQSRFVPIAAEQAVGKETDGETTKGLRVSAGKGEAVIRGVADRIDVYRKDGVTYVRVCDYKTGGKKFRLDDVREGLNLQMLLYLFSVCSGGDPRFGEHAVPAGVLYYPVKRPYIGVAENMDDGGVTEKASSEYKPNGILLADTDVLDAMERGVYGKFVPVKLTADARRAMESGKPLPEQLYDSRSPVLSGSAMGELEQNVRETVSRIACELADGRADASPKETADQYACRYCTLQPLCRRYPIYGKQGITGGR